MTEKEFTEEIRQHCISNKMKCPQCCLRIFCYISPSEKTEAMIDEVLAYLALDKAKI